MSESLRTALLIGAPIAFFLAMVVIGLCTLVGGADEHLDN